MKKIYIYGESSRELIETKLGIPLLGEVKLIPNNVKLLDQGKYQEVNLDDFAKIAQIVAKRGSK